MKLNGRWFPQIVDRQPWWLSGLRRSLVHSLMIVHHCVLRNWDRILVRAVNGLISWAGMVSICPFTVTKETLNSQQTKPQIVDRDSGNLYQIYIYIPYQYIQPVGGRSRATELPCCTYVSSVMRSSWHFGTSDSTYASPGSPRNEKNK